MPKKQKRTYNFKSLQGISSTNKPASGKDGGETTLSVNERLGELRRLEGKDAIQKKKELAENAANNQRSVPPNVRALLGIQDSAPLKPKRGVRTRMPNRTPGPAAPQSWLKRPALGLSLGAGRRSRSNTDKDRNRPNQLLRFAQLTGDEKCSNNRGSPAMLHLTLKATAQNWDLFDYDDLPALAEIPVRLRLRLLSYLGYYGPSIDVATFDALTQGPEPVTSLDLAGLFGHGPLTLHRVIKLIKSSKAPDTTPSETIAESWDQEDSFEAALNPSLTASRFSQLTHLSLSHPQAGASWRDLLSLSKHIPSLTHLSLAYWPRPTLTPNLATTTVSSQHSPDVHAGGSHYYSGLDLDLSEPSSLLRQLSANLLCLQWLDLEGCNEWIPALAYRGEDYGSFRGDDNDTTEAWKRTPAVQNIFVHNWKNLQYVHCPQGWFPDVHGMMALWKDPMAPPSQRKFVENYLYAVDAADFSRIEKEVKDDPYDVEKRKALTWVKSESMTQGAMATVNVARMTGGCKMLRLDHGW